MGATGSRCMEVWWPMSESSTLQDRLHTLEQLCVSIDAQHIARHVIAQNKHDELARQLQQTQAALEKLTLRQDKADLQIASLDLQQHALMESDMVILSS